MIDADDFSADGSLSGPYCVIAHTAEGEFVFSRHEKKASRDTAFSNACGFLDHDVDMVANGAPYTLYYSDDVIRFTKRDDPIAEDSPSNV